MSAADDWSDCRLATAHYLGESVSVAALLLDGDLRVVRSNRAFLGMAGGGPSPVGRSFDDLLSPPSRPAAERLLAGTSGAERLQFRGAGQSTFQVTCRVYREGQGQLLLADTLTLNDSQVLRAMSQMSGEVVNLGRELERKNRELQRALGAIKTLHGILTICMYCKRIKNDVGTWQKLEAYVCEHSDAEFSHGLCETCAQQHYPESVGEKS